MIRLSREQIRAVDRIAIQEYGVPGIVLMENAARSVFEVIRDRFGPLNKLAATIVCGGGNNGGDGYALARHLVNQGAFVMLADDGPPDRPGDAGLNRAIAKEMGIAVTSIHDLPLLLSTSTLVVDAMFGTGLSRPLEDPWSGAVKAMREAGLPIVAIDIPSGLDCDTGEPLGDACVTANLTVTLVAEKLGFANPRSRLYTGEIVVGEIGCPRDIIDAVLQGDR